MNCLHSFRIENKLKSPLREKCPNTEFFWSVFLRTWTEYGDLPRKSLYSVQMPESTDQKSSAFGHFLRSAHEKVCKNKDFCGILMPSENDNMLEFNQYMKSAQMPYIIYADIGSLIKK